MKEKIQESLYRFPYHYIPRLEGRNFNQTINTNWGFEYLSSLQFILNLISGIKFKSLLDAGCGDGRLLHELKKTYSDRSYLGIDISERALAMARIMTPDVEFIPSDIAKMKPLNKKFDIVTSIEVLEHIPPNLIKKYLESIRSLLKSEGILILSVPSVKIPIQSKHYQHFSLESLEKNLAGLFSIKQHYYLNRNIFRSRLLRKILTNRLFILNSQGMKNRLYRYYIKHYMSAKENDSSRLITICMPL